MTSKIRQGNKLQLQETPVVKQKLAFVYKFLIRQLFECARTVVTRAYTGSLRMRTWFFVMSSIVLLCLTGSFTAAGRSKGVEGLMCKNFPKTAWHKQRLAWSDLKCYKATFSAKLPLVISSPCVPAHSNNIMEDFRACQDACETQIAQARKEMLETKKFLVLENKCMSYTQRPEMTAFAEFVGRRDSGVFCHCTATVTVDAIFDQLSTRGPETHTSQSPWNCEPDRFAKWFGSHISNKVPIDEILTTHEVLEQPKECSMFRSNNPRDERFRDCFVSKKVQEGAKTPSEKIQKVTRSKKKMLHDSADEETRKKSKKMQCNKPSEQETSSRSEVPSSPSVEPTALAPGPDSTKQIMDAFWGDINLPDIVPLPWDEHEEL